MTAYKREGIPTLKGGHNERLATSSKRKADMAALDEALPAARRALTADQINTVLSRPHGTNYRSTLAPSSSSDGRSRAKLADNLSLHYIILGRHSRPIHSLTERTSSRDWEVAFYQRRSPGQLRSVRLVVHAVEGMRSRCVTSWNAVVDRRQELVPLSLEKK